MPLSTASDAQPNIAGPRARRGLNPRLLHPRGDGLDTVTESGVSSGRSTPVPDDAPPSVQAKSSARKQIRAQQKNRIFPTVEYEARLSHFDPNSDYRDFRGFFVLFWVGLAIMVITSMLRNLKENGNLLVIHQWHLFTENIWELAVSDGMMVGSTALALPLHLVYAKAGGLLRWSRLGMAVQSLFQAAWLSYWITWPFIRTWTWTAQVFFTLHILAMFMKMHSYAFYNGHLSETSRRLAALDKPETASKAAAVRYPGTHTRLTELSPDDVPSPEPKPRQSQVESLREDLAFELTSPLGNITYPHNLTVSNFADFILCPTLCYELEYPRTRQTNFMELFYKTLAVFGCIFLLTITTEEFVLPVLAEASSRLHTTPRPPLPDAALMMAEVISRLLFPFMVCFLLVFLVIFEYLLGAFAEITRFADRQFFLDWWNSCDWLEFSREWNIPVHNFFRRHVYSVSRRRMGRAFATGLTFFVSALAHELVMGCISKKLRGYGFFAMMLQMPIVMVQRSRWLRGRTLLNNILFWCSMILGLAMMCALYVLV